MPRLILLNKPFNVLCQFTDPEGRKTLADFVPVAGVYPAGRLDRDSEGLLLLTNDGRLQAALSDPRYKLPKTYWVQVEGEISDAALVQFEQGVLLDGEMTRPAQAQRIPEPTLPPRDPPVRFRQHIPTSWLEIVLREGRHRQVRRMTASVDFPTLRLWRQGIGPLTVAELAPGAYREATQAEWACLQALMPPLSAIARPHQPGKGRSRPGSGSRRRS